ncbi:hypothetical protein TSAR_002178 [Trichomalopsis sarcophagae]|uniref:Uncharacterized protein n=1 Tax=Trichomalopsis sarcophagae TaxID=543379 RepID=A0A232EZ06_9HYME|nr:hypothetical protein TSAR_002178 [Trichomalopsis sarcophagae]
MINLSSKSLSVAINESFTITPLTSSNLRYKANRIKRLRKDTRYNVLRPSPKTRMARQNRAALNHENHSLRRSNSKDEQVTTRLLLESKFECTNSDYVRFLFVTALKNFMTYATVIPSPHPVQNEKFQTAATFTSPIISSSDDKIANAFSQKMMDYPIG